MQNDGNGTRDGVNNRTRIKTERYNKRDKPNEGRKEKEVGYVGVRM